MGPLDKSMGYDDQMTLLQKLLLTNTLMKYKIRQSMIKEGMTKINGAVKMDILLETVSILMQQMLRPF